METTPASRFANIVTYVEKAKLPSFAKEGSFFLADTSQY